MPPLDGVLGFRFLKKNVPPRGYFGFQIFEKKCIECVSGFRFMKKKMLLLDGVIGFNLLRKKYLPRSCFWIQIFEGKKGL